MSALDNERCLRADIFGFGDDSGVAPERVATIPKRSRAPPLCGAVRGRVSFPSRPGPWPCSGLRSSVWWPVRGVVGRWVGLCLPAVSRRSPLFFLPCLLRLRFALVRAGVLLGRGPCAFRQMPDKLAGGGSTLRCGRYPTLVLHCRGNSRLQPKDDGSGSTTRRPTLVSCCTGLSIKAPTEDLMSCEREASEKAKAQKG
jgi:hypothetical protein